MDAPDIVIAEIDKNSRELLRIQLTEYKGNPFVDIRILFDIEGEMRPTRKGVTINPKLLPALADAINKAISVATERGLMGDDGVDPERKVA